MLITFQNVAECVSYRTLYPCLFEYLRQGLKALEASYDLDFAKWLVMSFEAKNIYRANTTVVVVVIKVESHPHRNRVICV